MLLLKMNKDLLYNLKSYLDYRFTNNRIIRVFTEKLFIIILNKSINNYKNIRMQKQRHKIQFKNYVFQLNFKTQYSSSITATDRFQGRKFQNKNVQFMKLQSETILNALQQKSPKKITCKITEAKIHNEKQQQKFMKQADSKKAITKSSQHKQNYSKKCLQIEFIVTLDYILPFSQTIILYEIQSWRRTQNVIPSKLESKMAKQLKKNIQQIDRVIPTPQQGINNFACYQILSKQLQKPQHQSDRQMFVCIGLNVLLFLIFIFYLSFWEYLIYEAALLGSIYLFFQKQRYSVQKISVKKGYYKIQVSGIISMVNYNGTAQDSFKLHLCEDEWHSQSLKLYGKSQYSYGYGFNGTFLVHAKNDKQLEVKIEKNTKIYSTSITSVVITVEKLPQLFLKA